MRKANYLQIMILFILFPLVIIVGCQQQGVSGIDLALANFAKAYETKDIDLLKGCLAEESSFYSELVINAQNVFAHHEKIDMEFSNVTINLYDDGKRAMLGFRETFKGIGKDGRIEEIESGDIFELIKSETSWKITFWYRDIYMRQPMTHEEFMQGLPSEEPLAINQIHATSFVPSEKSNPSASLVIIIVNSSIQPSIQNSLDQYVLDLENEGYSVTIYAASGGTPNDLRAYLQGQLPNGLVGCLLVGDLPVPWYQVFDDFYGYPGSVLSLYAEFPIDLYYMDLDGTWTDVYNAQGQAKPDGIYDGHSDGSGDRYPEIWVGRLTTPLGTAPVRQDEATLLQNYFRKNHAYRTGGIILSNRALAYVDDDWVRFGGCRLNLAYADVTSIIDVSKKSLAPKWSPHQRF